MVYSGKTAIINKIEKAANQLIFTYGVKGWNMDDCAREAGITKRTLYQHIESKENLIGHVLSEFIRTTQQNLVQELSNCPDFIIGMEKIIQIFPKMIMKLNSQIIQNIFIAYPDIETLVVQKRLILAEESLKYIRKGQQEGFVKKSVEAETILEILQSLVIYYSRNNPKNFEEKLKAGLISVLYGILEPAKEDRR